MNTAEIANWIIYFMLILAPYLLTLTRQVPWNIEIETSFMTGMMTASGIFFALITSFAATQRRLLLPGSMILMLLFDGALLVAAGGQLFLSAINQTSQLSALMSITASFYANGYTALSILILRVFGKYQPD